MARFRACAISGVVRGLTLFDIRLAALRPAEAEALLDNLVGGPLDPHSRAVLLRRAEGNPAAGPLDERNIPEIVQGVIMARVDRLSRSFCASPRWSAGPS